MRRALSSPRALRVVTASLAAVCILGVLSSAEIAAVIAEVDRPAWIVGAAGITSSWTDLRSPILIFGVGSPSFIT